MDSFNDIEMEEGGYWKTDIMDFLKLLIPSAYSLDSHIFNIQSKWK